MATAMFRQMQEFDQDKEDWSQYVEWLENFFRANSMEDSSKKTAVLLIIMGPSTDVS